MIELGALRGAPFSSMWEGYTMAKRIQVGVRVPVIELEMPDGKILTWKFGIHALVLLAEMFGGGVGDLVAVSQKFADDPSLMYHDLLYAGLKGQHRDLTMEDVRAIPENVMLFSAIAQALLDTQPEGVVRPTIPDLVLTD